MKKLHSYEIIGSLFAIHNLLILRIWFESFHEENQMQGYKNRKRVSLQSFSHANSSDDKSNRIVVCVENIRPKIFERSNWIMLWCCTSWNNASAAVSIYIHIYIPRCSAMYANFCVCVQRIHNADCYKFIYVCLCVGNRI